MIKAYDDNMIRCPRVGGEVNFKFCRTENNMLPCRWIVGCWQRRIEINNFLEDHYSNEELTQIFSPPKPKIESLLSLVEKAKKVKQEDD
jgi:hypothetical protein